MDSGASVVEVVFESTVKNVEAVEEVSRRVCMVAGFGEEAEFQVEMAVHEVVINAVRHGNREDPSKKVVVKFLIFSDHLEIHVRDQGDGFDPTTLADPLAEENLLNVSGRGIFLARKFMDEFRVEHSGVSGTEVVMVKRLGSMSNQGGRDREHEGDCASH